MTPEQPAAIPRDSRVPTATDLAGQFPEWKRWTMLAKLTNGAWSFTTSVSR